MKNAFSQTYKYEPLPDTSSIRVLQLNPRSVDGAVISGSLILRRLYEKEPRYISLSYSWGRNLDGDATLTRTVLLDGCEFPVAENLYDFLFQIAASGKILPLWIDAVCINQNDMEERSKQVSIMASIYQKAANLVIWLGHGTDESEDREAMDALELVPRVQDWLNSKRMDMPEQIVDTGQSGPHMVRYQASLVRFCQRRYFQRRWVIQEIHNSKPDQTILTWGIYQIGAHEFCNRLRGIKYLVETEGVDGKWIGSGFKRDFEENWASLRKIYNLMTLQETWDPTKRFRSGQRVLDCLFAFQDTKCADDRDRVYSLLNFAGADNHMSHSADYSLDTTDAYVAFASSLVEEGRLENVLTLASWQTENGHRRESAGEDMPFPSWCPDFRYNLREGHSTPHLRNNKPLRGYSSYDIPKPKVKKNRVLQIRVKIGRLLPEQMRAVASQEDLETFSEEDHLCQLAEKDNNRCFVLRAIPNQSKQFVLVGSWQSAPTNDSPKIWRNCRDVGIQTITVI